jgi:hypothetical protein
MTTKRDKLLEAALSKVHRDDPYLDGALYVSPVQIIELLHSVSQSERPVKHAARYLLGQIGQREWEVSSGLKRGGKGDRDRGPDDTLHVTLRLLTPERQYHLRLTATRMLFDITCPKDPSLPTIKWL